MIDLVIFDCDGVLIDSEAIADRIVAADLSSRGLAMTPHEARGRFIGMAFPDMDRLIRREFRLDLPPDWKTDIVARLTRAMAAEVEAIPGAVAALDAVEVRGLDWCVASNSSHMEMAAKFGRTGLADRVAGRAFSAQDVARGKPAPDLFLHAAETRGFVPARCVVIEDSRTGVTAALAAGMRCLGFAPDGDPYDLAALDVPRFTAMATLPGLLDGLR